MAWKQIILGALTAAFTTAAPLLVQAATLDLIVLRSDDAVEVFTSTRADTYVELFGLDPQALAEPDGTVDFDALREGTFDTAEDMFTSVRAQISGQPAVFEAMSMMVHPIDDRLSFLTPVDGMVAMAVCTVPTPDVPPTMETLWGYAGFIAFTERAGDDVHLTLDAMTVPGVDVSVRYFTTEGFQGRETLTLLRGDTLVLGAPTASMSPIWLWVAVAAMALSAGGLTYRMLMRLSTRPTASTAS